MREWLLSTNKTKQSKHVQLNKLQRERIHFSRAIYSSGREQAPKKHGMDTNYASSPQLSTIRDMDTVKHNTKIIVDIYLNIISQNNQTKET